MPTNASQARKPWSTSNAAAHGCGPPASDPDLDDDWLDAEIEAMAAAWERGDAVRAEAYLQGPIGLSDQAAVRLIYEEVCLRRESGEVVDTVEITARFPRLRAELERLLQCDRLMRPGEDAVFPDVGETLGDFQLVAELGRGRSGRTFLAVQPALADRAVVLKVTRRDLREHLSLARLQHTHIVPLYSEHVFANRGLRALCMPFLGGATLETILTDLDSVPVERRQGSDVARALDYAKARQARAQAITSSPFRADLDQITYVDAICRIGVCVAEALQYAHDHGLVHMDVKPANVLIAADGKPMLLDFHLARSPVLPGEAPPERLGGTPGWMSPELRRAIDALKAHTEIVETVDARSDVYSLGMLLYDALGGNARAPSNGSVPRLERCRQSVSVGLTDIIEKCLEPEPARRYARAGAVADDLRRHLCDLPLAGVPNRSLPERWRKWKRRRPHAVARYSAWVAKIAAILVVLAVGGAYQHQRVRDIQASLADAERFTDERLYAQAARSAERGLLLTQKAIGTRELRQALEVQRKRAHRGIKVRELHELMNRVRLRSTADPKFSSEAESLLGAGRVIWNERGRLLPATNEGRLSASEEQELKTDLMELARIWADLRVRLAPASDRDRARTEANAVLDEAEASLGVYAEPVARGAEYEDVASDLDPPESRRVNDPRKTGWDHDLRGRALLRSGDLPAALVEFRRALTIRPQEFWLNFYEGVCAYRLGRHEEALAAFRTCVALAPETPECYFNRALALAALHRPGEAADDYTTAVTLDPSFAQAYLNRGLLAHQADRYDAAAADYDRALQHTKSRSTRGRVLYNMALARQAQGHHARALAAASEALTLGDHDAIELVARLRGER